MAKAKLGLVSSFESRVKTSLAKERKATIKLLDSDPDPVTRTQILASFSKSEAAARKRISAEDFTKILKKEKFLKTVVHVETGRKVDADKKILNLMKGDLSNPTTKTSLIFARRASADANGKIIDSLADLNRLGNDLTNTSARATQFGNKKRTFAP